MLKNACYAILLCCVSCSVLQAQQPDVRSGFKKHFITQDGQVKDICVGTGIAANLQFYYNRPARPNEKHGVGSVIDAGMEVIKLKRMLASR